MADEPRPPFVRFEIRVEEDRQASVDAGHYVGKDVIYAIVTPIGSRDTIERNAEEWIAGLAEGVKQERIPASWESAYRRALKDFQESRETPDNGTPIKDWPGASPAQIKTMLDINVRTVEDLAEANEETVGRIGMGGRALKQKAKTWLKSANETGKNVEKVNALEIENSELKTTVKELTERLAKLESKQTEEA